MSKKGHYSGGSTIIKIYPTATKRCPKPGALSLWVEQYETAQKVGVVPAAVVKLVAPVSARPALEQTAPEGRKPKKAKKKGQKQPKPPNHFPKPTKAMREKNVKKFIQKAKRSIETLDDDEGSA